MTNRENFKKKVWSFVLIAGGLSGCTSFGGSTYGVGTRKQLEWHDMYERNPEVEAGEKVMDRLRKGNYSE